ncbi:MAG: NAD(P)H-hydrate epimerase [Candidatus Micrarchaeales archaeon]|jgi:yjeF N-terminal region|uniref:NAD(P)H-hydrate epimerase n=1 Tax=Candidatus Micrarchaeum acidiphilum ARMAN-2 TaxID=425595 RepID=C7DG47_MICA2|nr:MAG: carbohydrate kinase, YjeF related protein [Candidatus Micrarchaeum acidiphilum ARMAN-2]MCW6161069.1 NAD(P)H-hydrate epimerase [Candidatus Micrarchaeales archaeon]
MTENIEEYITTSEMSRLERAAVERGTTIKELMENAGAAVAREAAAMSGSLEGKLVMVFAGPGNNGGDGMVSARHLAAMHCGVVLVLLSKPEKIKSEEARANFEALNGIPNARIEIADSEEKVASLAKEFPMPYIIIDAIFGTGVKGEPSGQYGAAIEFINRTTAIKIAVDIPSGLDPDTGKTAETCVRADVTVAMHRAKQGMKGNEAYTGRVVVADIGIGK